ncbi:MAG: galactose mutarotase [Clostridia bacterium]|nr:galactose mutarotase [Clostridia bacterium]
MVKKTSSFIKNGLENQVWTLTNKNGCSMQMTNYGARIISLIVPDKNGNLSDVIVGAKNPADYYDIRDYFGATVGRCCNRIEDGKFTLNGTPYQVEINQNGNCLHGGKTASFDRAIWQARAIGETLRFTLFSEDGASGFPGNMKVTADYTLTDENSVVFEVTATSDKDTLCNLTQHSFFNIGDDQTVLDQLLTIDADKITPVDERLLCHGDFLNVDNTPFDFRTPKRVGQDIFSNHPITSRSRGYDINFCINRKSERDLEHCATLFDQKSGRVLECWTTLPGLQIYTTNGDKVFETFEGKKPYVKHCAICLETQFFPNSPNCPNYPSVVLKKGEVFHHKTIYKFLVK